MKKSLPLASLILLMLILIQSCKKEELPTLSTSSVSNITATAASSGGNITSDGGAEIISRGICWGVNPNPTTSDLKTSDGTGAGQFVSNLNGLSSGLTYHVRAYATNKVGTAYGADLSFETLGKTPECITQAATNILAIGATLNGTVNANHLSTTVTFEYGLTTSYGQTITATQSPVTGNSITNVNAAITGLGEGTTYHYRVKAANSIGTSLGEDMVFTALGQAPTAITMPACCISSTGATLNGTVNANYASTVVTFEYGTTGAYGNTVAASPNQVTGNNNTNVSAGISGLTPGTTYHFRPKATSSLGITYGSDVTFTTLDIPRLSTNAIIGITSNSAYGGGNITSDGGSAIIIRGVCWGANANPTIDLSTKTTDDAGTGSFISNITGLTPGTLYHVRAYATNVIGTAYGNDLTFTTHAVIPTVSTSTVSSVTHNSALCGGNIINNGGATITARGICWGTSANPTITGSHTIDGTGLGSFTNSMNCLSDATTYFVRAYATNSSGTAYGDQQSFTTEPSPIAFNPNLTYGTVMDIDGNCYKTIQIGDQTWMAENLKTSKYNDGTSIPLVTDNSAWNNLVEYHVTVYISPGFCWYNNDMVNYKDKYGALYNGAVVRSVNNDLLCPVGWHVPTIAEWAILENFLDGPNEAGGHLKEASLNHWVNPNTGADNTTGFTALPGGHRNPEGEFDSLRYVGYWWTSTNVYRMTDYSRSMYFDNKNVSSQISTTNNGLSIRCVKN